MGDGYKQATAFSATREMRGKNYNDKRRARASTTAKPGRRKQGTPTITGDAEAFIDNRKTDAMLER